MRAGRCVSVVSPATPRDAFRGVTGDTTESSARRAETRRPARAAGAPLCAQFAPGSGAKKRMSAPALDIIEPAFGVTTRSSFSAGTRAEGGVLHGGSLTGRVRLRAPRPGPRGARRPAGRTAPQAGERLSPTAAAGAGRAWSPGQASHASTSRSAPFNRAISKTRRSRRASPTLTTTEGPAGIFPPRNCRGMPYNEALRESHVSSPRSGRRGRRCVRGASLRLGDQRLDNDQVFPGFL